MIKVIKHGQRANYATCTACQCELAYTDDEIKTMWENVQYTTVMLGRKYITCPECGADINIQKSPLIMDTNMYY